MTPDELITPVNGDEVEKIIDGMDLVILDGMLFKVRATDLIRRMWLELQKLRGDQLELLDELTELELEVAKLAALESGGVDNWEWYSESINEHFVDPTGEGRKYWDC